MAVASVAVIGVDGVVREVTAIKWNTTVKQLIFQMYPSGSNSEITPEHQKTSRFRTTSLSLQEVWRGCSQPIPMDQRISSVVGGWGYHQAQGKEVRLMIVRRDRKYENPLKRRKYYCGKVASRKRCHGSKSNKYTVGTSKKAMVQSILKIIKRLQDKKMEVDNLLSPKESAVALPADTECLPNDQKEEGQTLIDAIADEKKEKKDLSGRKNELFQRISSQEREIKEVKEQVSDLEAKILNEKHKLNNLREVKNSPEVEDLKKEIAQLKNELKVRTKLNRIQSTKMQDLTTAVLEVEEELKSCQQDIELLKLSTPL